MLQQSQSAPLMLLCLLISMASASVPTSTQGLVADTLKDLAAIRRSVYNFWACNGLDAAYGGFYGTLLRDGSPTAPEEKGLVQGTRHAW
jgi:hypothetical protein